MIATQELVQVSYFDVLDAVSLAFSFVQATPCEMPEAPVTAGVPRWSSLISIEGAWRGGVLVTVPQDFVKASAEKVFGAPEEGKAEDDARDVLTELTNVIGGNVKALFSTASGSLCRLSLPVVSLGPIELPVSFRMHEFHLECDGHPVNVTVFEWFPRTRGAR